MRFTLPSLVLVSGLAQVGTATWIVDFYEKGCPKDGDTTNLDSVGSTSGQKGDEMWCYPVDSAHSGVLRGIEADGYKVDLFTDWLCHPQYLIETWTTDGCFVVNSEPNTVIAGARIVPK
ncbi:hypothetical protein C8A01DRAFT_35115 [Parachaetomium inaequale]|uniref:Uncharacterized protein n=1 Tax=Parachaetomium inaequale TaxID=2588326 RepID=A0AAN6PLS5_9PEZI|nr:hypothetical protein C8A01DRAFT_35115 [Parachaetomium inaequale]